MTDNVQIEHSNGILTLTLARPDKKNALTNEMYGKLADALEAADQDSSVRVILIRGQGDSFTAGNDIGEFAAVAAGAAKGERHVMRFIRSLPQGYDLATMYTAAVTTKAAHAFQAQVLIDLLTSPDQQALRSRAGFLRHAK